MQKKLRTFISGYIESFPSLPTVVKRVMEITADAESSTEELFDVISADQSLAINVLKMANSIFYGERLLTTSNPRADHDQRLFERLGLRPA